VQALPRSASGELVKVLSSRVGHVTPAYLHWLYNTWGYMPAATDRNVIGVLGFLGDYPSQDDLDMFMNAYFSEGAGTTTAFVQVGDGNLAAQPHAEANVDVQYAEAIAYPTPLIYYSTVGVGLLRSWLQYVLGQAGVPQTISISYVNNETDIPADYAIALCQLLGQLGLRGASVLVSSGDSGVGLGDCRVNDGSGSKQFLPTFPSSCTCGVFCPLQTIHKRSYRLLRLIGPFVTSVGGTVDHSPEVAAAFSSGGFSNYFTRPIYQEDAVSLYVQSLGDLYRGFYK
jgi:tripeptidyl-peptidase-1